MRLALLALAVVLAGPARADYALILATTEGFAGSTPDFYGVRFEQGDAGTTISSVSFTLPADAFTSPAVLDLASLVGLTPADITFSGDETRSLTVRFAPGSFGVGDSFHFDAAAEVGGSRLGGAFGAGATFSATLEDGSGASTPFRTNTSVDSLATLQVPEPSAFLILSLAALSVGFAWGLRRL